MAEEVEEIIISDSVIMRAFGRETLGAETRLRVKAEHDELLLGLAVRDIGNFAEFTAKRHVPHRTSNLERNVTFVGPTKTSYGYKGDIAIRKGAPYGKWVAKGTGFHDVVPHWIMPKRGHVMRWEESGAFATRYQGRYVIWSALGPKRWLIFALRTKGQKAQPFMRTAWLETRHVYLPARLEVLAREVGHL